jgi:hypothetical protein
MHFGGLAGCADYFGLRRTTGDDSLWSGRYMV